MGRFPYQAAIAALLCLNAARENLAEELAPAPDTTPTMGELPLEATVAADQDPAAAAQEFLSRGRRLVQVNEFAEAIPALAAAEKSFSAAGMQLDSAKVLGEIGHCHQQLKNAAAAVEAGTPLPDRIQRQSARGGRVRTQFS